MPRVIGNTGRLLNQGSHAFEGPEFGGVALDLWSLHEGAPDLLKIFCGQTGGCSGMPFGLEAAVTMRVPGLVPLPGGHPADAEVIGYPGL